MDAIIRACSVKEREIPLFILLLSHCFALFVFSAIDTNFFFYGFVLSFIYESKRLYTVFVSRFIKMAIYATGFRDYI